MNNSCKPEIVDLMKDNSVEKYILECKNVFFDKSLTLIQKWNEKSPTNDYIDKRLPKTSREIPSSFSSCSLPSVTLASSAVVLADPHFVPLSGGTCSSPLTSSTRSRVSRRVLKLERSSVRKRTKIKHSTVGSRCSSSQMSETKSSTRHHFNASLHSHPSTSIHNNKAKTRGYPTYFERFLATIFSWDPDWCRRAAISFNVDGLKLPTSFIWLENNIKLIRERNCSFRNYSELKSTLIPTILLQLFKEVSERSSRYYLSAESPFKRPEARVLVTSMTSNDYTRKEVEENVYLAEVHFKVDRGEKENQTFKEGDLVIVQTRIQTVFTQFALVTGVETKFSPESVNPGDDLLKVRVQDHVTLLMKKTSARKLLQKKFEVTSVMNIESFILQGKAVYQFNGCRKFFLSFLDPVPERQTPEARFSSTNYSSHELYAINAVVDFVLSHNERNNILVTISKEEDNLKFNEIFLEIIEQVSRTFDENGKLLIVVPNDEEWHELIAAQFILSALKGFYSRVLPKIYAVSSSSSTPGEVIKKWFELFGSKKKEYWFEHCNQRQLFAPYSQFKMNEMSNEISKNQIVSSQIIVCSWSNFLTKEMKTCLEDCQFASCLIYDEGLSLPEVCAVCTWHNVNSILLYGGRGDNQSFPTSFSSRYNAFGSCIRF